MHWPALRRDLTWLPADPAREEPAAIFDPALNRRVNLGPVSAALVARLGGDPVELSPLISEVAAESERPPTQVEHVLRTLMLMNLISGCGETILRRASDLRAGRIPCPPRFLPGTRFGCQGSGDCCKSYVFGPLREQDLAALADLSPAIQAALPDLGPGPYVREQPMADGTTGMFLRTEGQRCVFQRGDGRCGLHAALGEAAKPAMCRLYPYQHMPTLWGRRLYDRGECARFSMSAQDGPLLADEAERILGLLPAEFEIYHPLVWLDGETPCDYGHFYPLQEALCALCEEPLAPGALLLGLSRQLQRFVAGLRSCPLRPGEPETTLARVLAQPVQPGCAAQTDTTEEGVEQEHEDRLALGRVISELRYAVAPRRMILQLARSQHRANQQAQDLDDVLMNVEALLVREAAPFAHQALPATAARVVQEGLRHSLRQQLYGHALLPAERPVAGLLRIACGALLTVTRAWLLSRGGAIGVPEFDAGHSLAMRALSQDFATGVFLAQEADAWGAIRCCAALLGG